MIQIIESGNKYGTMNTGTMPKNLTPEEKRKIFMEHRMALGEDFGFDGHKMFMADQKDKKGTYFNITKEYVDANPNGWTDINEDILIVTDKVPGVVIGHPVADCPVVIMEDKKNGVCAIAHCSADLIDLKMPMMVADALLEAYKSDDADIIAYVSACAGKNSYIYDCYPNWATDNNLWKDAIVEENGIFKIDLRKAIRKELEERNIMNVTYNNDDTITNASYFSNSAAKNGQEEKFGRNFAGAFYKVKK